MAIANPENIDVIVFCNDSDLIPLRFDFPEYRYIPPKLPSACSSQCISMCHHYHQSYEVYTISDFGSEGVYQNRRDEANAEPHHGGIARNLRKNPLLVPVEFHCVHRNICNDMRQLRNNVIDNSCPIGC